MQRCGRSSSGVLIGALAAVGAPSSLVGSVGAVFAVSCQPAPAHRPSARAPADGGAPVPAEVDASTRDVPEQEDAARAQSTADPRRVLSSLWRQTAEIELELRKSDPAYAIPPEWFNAPEVFSAFPRRAAAVRVELWSPRSGDEQLAELGLRGSFVISASASGFYGSDIDEGALVARLEKSGFARLPNGDPGGQLGVRRLRLWRASDRVLVTALVGGPYTEGGGEVIDEMSMLQFFEGAQLELASLSLGGPHSEVLLGLPIVDRAPPILFLARNAAVAGQQGSPRYDWAVCVGGIDPARVEAALPNARFTTPPGMAKTIRTWRRAAEAGRPGTYVTNARGPARSRLQRKNAFACDHSAATTWCDPGYGNVCPASP